MLIFVVFRVPSHRSVFESVVKVIINIFALIGLRWLATIAFVVFIDGFSVASVVLLPACRSRFAAQTSHCC